MTETLRCGNCRDCVECLSRIPGDKTCSSCANYSKCHRMFGVKGTEHHCDFYPSRYRPAPHEVTP